MPGKDGDGRLALTIRPATRTRIGLDRWFGFPIRLVATPMLMSSTFAGPPLLDFSSPDVVRTCQVINDDVMGGLSKSRLNRVSGSMSFTGEVSLENNGGFASFRGPVRFPADSTVLLLTARGDGRRYKLTLKFDDGPRTAQYQAAFVASQEWETLRFQPADFRASFRGRAVAAPPLRFVDARYVGLLISDKQPGPFRIDLKEIRTEARGSKTGM